MDYVRFFFGVLSGAIILSVRFGFWGVAHVVFVYL